MTRTLFTRMLASAAMLSALSAPGHSAIFDRDDRQFVTVEQGSVYSPIGIVVSHNLQNFRWPLRAATGFLVDDCHVLTARNVMTYKDDLLGRRLKFQTGVGTPHSQWTKGRVVAVGGGERSQTSNEEVDRRAAGWLLLRLEQCVGQKSGHVTLKSGPFSVGEFRGVMSAGFPKARGRRHGATIDPSCNLLGANSTTWRNDCATVAGNLGDPIFRIDTSGSRPQLVVYAMQTRAYMKRRPVPTGSGFESGAVPMAWVAPQIEPFLSAQGQDRSAPGR